MEKERHHGQSRRSGASAAVVPIDQTVGDYRIGHEIGKGSFAMVYKGVNTKTGMPVAIKSVIRARLKKRLLENLESEIHILKTLAHPHIVQLFEKTDSPTYVHLIMEYCALEDLSVFMRKRDRLSRMPCIATVMERYPNSKGGGLNEVLVRHFLKQMASAILFLREKNLIHRDLKPQNMLLCPPSLSETEAAEKGYVGMWSLPVLKLADFGFARILPNTSLAETLCGSPLYMAPEILRYEKYDAKADLWSVGTILYELCQGTPPFKAENYIDLVRKIEANGDRIAFAEGVPVSDGLKRLICGLLRRSPVERMGFREFSEDETVCEDIASGSFTSASSVIAPSSDALSAKETPSIRAPVSIVRAKTTDEPRVDSSSDAAVSEKQSSRDTTAPPVAQTVSNTESTRQPTAHNQVSTPLAIPVVTGPVITDEPDFSPARSDRRRSSGTSILSIATPPIPQVTTASPLLGRAASLGRPEDDVMFEREYVVVEKRTVEVNKFADEVANSPRAFGSVNSQRRMSSSSRNRFSPGSTSGTRWTSSTDQRRNYGDSPSSSLGRAVAMASARLIGRSGSSGGYSPSARGGQSPQEYDQNLTENELGVLMRLEATTAKSNVVYELANVKFEQLMPMTPSSNFATTSDLTPQAVAALSEEALVLYVKALSLLANVMDIAGSWWACNESKTVSPRLINTVEWSREQFNEALNRAQLVRMKLANSTGQGSQSFEGTRVTAEKLLYDRAIDMSRQAAMNELVGDNLAECEIMYETTICLLDAILEVGAKEKPIDEEDKRMVDGSK
ncbi:kinase-like domain-containing protein [Limtongia smithiae]|uniref:kinase-like domain-containing protein n=1 Tax=Limtongia smithiae TaxID=1125753 RepID=UPI0034CE00C4